MGQVSFLKNDHIIAKMVRAARAYMPVTDRPDEDEIRLYFTPAQGARLAVSLKYFAGDGVQEPRFCLAINTSSPRPCSPVTLLYTLQSEMEFSTQPNSIACKVLQALCDVLKPMACAFNGNPQAQAATEDAITATPNVVRLQPRKRA